jgi:hypothetical protein
LYEKNIFKSDINCEKEMVGEGLKVDAMTKTEAKIRK